MFAATLHYIHDPLCGWCYAVTPLIAAIREAGVPIALHGGGLWEPTTRLDPDKRRYIRDNDARIAALTGMTFGPAYLDGLLADRDTLLWSRPTIAAILAAGTIRPDAELAMLQAIQHAHYVEGRRVVESAVLADVANAIDLDRTAFVDALNAVPVDMHVARTREWMQRYGLRGFPGFVVENEGKFARVEHEPFYGQPPGFLRSFTALLAA